ncbi:helicase associated domain-containing protein [Streptomyces sp. NPDC001652]|uniref:helicase associated domain-containing protein n=1 Tax=Streptomyces sp. NPDC001652 TaxID=3154393 RepID=UPI003327E3C6
MLRFTKERDPAVLTHFVRLRVIDPERAYWLRGIEAATRWLRETGNGELRVPYTYVTPDDWPGIGGHPLGAWVADQRRDYAAVHGHCFPPSSVVWQDMAIGTWAKIQRAAAKTVRPNAARRAAGETGISSAGDAAVPAGGAGRDRSRVVPTVGDRMATLPLTAPPPHPGRRHTAHQDGRTTGPRQGPRIMDCRTDRRVGQAHASTALPPREPRRRPRAGTRAPTGEEVPR